MQSEYLPQKQIHKNNMKMTVLKHANNVSKM